MTISTDYPRPITVNGYVCRNCDDVSDVRKFIDPAAPKGGAIAPADQNTAVAFGGSLAPQNARTGTNTSRPHANCSIATPDRQNLTLPVHRQERAGR
ncbi:MAG: hypothetical protein MO852_06250 [Candidatus Devosia euplotis]|nr:hypothetical protein [Candidatus Devosia euplotis]